MCGTDLGFCRYMIGVYSVHILGQMGTEMGSIRYKIGVLGKMPLFGTRLGWIAKGN